MGKLRLILIAAAMLTLAAGLWGTAAWRAAAQRAAERDLRAVLVEQVAAPDFVARNFAPPHAPPTDFALRDYVDRLVAPGDGPLDKARAFARASAGRSLRVRRVLIRDGAKTFAVALRPCGHAYCPIAEADLSQIPRAEWAAAQMRFRVTAERVDLALPQGTASGVRAWATLYRTPDGLPAQISAQMSWPRSPLVDWYERLSGRWDGDNRDAVPLARRMLILDRDLLADPIR